MGLYSKGFELIHHITTFDGCHGDSDEDDNGDDDDDKDGGNLLIFVFCCSSLSFPGRPRR